jgi:amino acid adenylation domain-containing protein
MDARAGQTLSPYPAAPGEPTLFVRTAEPATLPDVLRLAAQEVAPGQLIQVRAEGEEVVLCYREVQRRAERVLGGLRARGTRPGDEVVLQIDAAEEFVPALWACILGGFTAVPVGVAGPHEGNGLAAQRLRDVWTMLDRPPVLAGTGLAGSVHALLGPDARVAPVEELVAHAPDTAWYPSPPGAVAVLLLSSGTTGQLKLIQRTHHNLLCICRRVPGLAGSAGSSLTLLNWLPLDHNAGLTATLAVLAAGARQVHLGTRDVLEDPTRWLDAIHDHRVSHTGGTNYSLGLVNECLAAAGPRAWDFSCVQSITVTAEPVVARTVRDFVGHMSRYGLRSGALRAAYGMSEVGGITRLSELRLDGSGDAEAFVEAGTPYPGIALRVVDERGRPVPDGREGRIQVRGDTVTPGYARDPEQTRKSFTRDGWFDTGDAGFLRADSLTITGREREVLIVNGLNLQSQQIEAVVETVEGVERGFTAVCPVRLPGRDTDAAAVFLHTPLGGAEERDALRQEVRRVVVSRFGATVAYVLLVGRDEIPRTAVGKIRRSTLRRRLDAGDFAAAVAEDAVAGAGDRRAGPRSGLERELCAVWAEVLGLDVSRVGIHDDFLGLGGHSLLATRVVSRIRTALSVELPLRVLFEGPTVAELAGRVEALRRAAGPSAPAAVPSRVDRTAAAPASFAQERLWFLERLRPGSSLFNIPFPLRIEGALDRAALERALGEIVRRQGALRTTLADAPGPPVQVVAPFAGFVLPVEDLSELGEKEREAEVRRRAADHAERPFDLSAGPLFRAGLLRLGGEEHVLLLCMHHVVGDGWSVDVFFRELAAFYAAYREGRESPLPEPTVEYADYAAWQREQLRGEAMERQLAWWRERLSGAPELLELPTDHPRPAVRTNGGAREPIRVGDALARRLEVLGRSEGATPFMVLLGAFQALLSRYAGSGDVVVGSTIAGRTRAEVEGLIGLFMNMLALRTDLSDDPTFLEVLRRVRDATLGAYEYQDLPFDRLVEELRPVRSLGHAPLVQVLLELHNTGSSEPDLPGLRVRAVATEVGTAKFDLEIALSATPRGLEGGLTYSTDLFERGTARRMVEHLGRVLEQIAAHPERRLSQLELLGPGERRQLLEQWNRTAADYPAGRCIHQLFEAQAERTPLAPALTFAGRTLSYAELEERANRMAHHLIGLGVRPEVRVGIYLERGPELLACILGVLKAGGAYVPLDPTHPAERNGYVLEDSGVAVLLTQARLRARLPVREGVRVLSVDAQQERIAGGRAGRPCTAVDPESLCYVIYTSGSTGRPKGVAMHHRGVCNYIHWGIGFYGADQGSGAPVFSSMAVDLTLTNLLPLFAGRPVHLLAEESPVEALAEALRAGPGYGMIKITPVHLSLLSPLLGPEQARAAARTLVIGADFLSAETTRFWQEHAPGVRLINEYGPTETVVGCSAYVLPPGRHRVGPVPVGGPIGNMRFYVLDAAMQPVPVGLPGELYIGGVGVARGYLGRAQLTAEKFVPDPYGPAGTRMYRTGDRARWLEGGELLILGRTDAQVKVRGYRVEPGEVEAALRRQAGVRECLVVVREEAPGDRRLVAYVVGEAETAALREALLRSLPEYMVPAAFVPLEALPQTATGKLDPRALPDPEYGSGEERHVAPRTPTEEVLAGIWAAVLRRERVGAADDFFALGGHSLLAIQVVSRVREAFAVEVPLRALFEGPTVVELARRVEALRRAELPTLPPVVPVERTRGLPLSFAQERLWFLDRLQPESAFYNVPLALRLDGALDARALERALGEVVRRHEALRTVFREVDGGPVQVIAPAAGFALTTEDLSGLEEESREAEAERRATAEAARPFDLVAGPVFRARLLRLASEAHVLLLSMHHVASDGWSLGVLFRELSALYGAYRGGGESPLSALPVQYADFAVWQRSVLRGAALERHLSFWRERLAGAPALLELPTDYPRPAVQTFRGAYERVELSGELVERLRGLGRSESATLHMLLLGAFQVLLAKYAGSEDVVVGTPVAGRTRRETEELIGFFVNTLVVRTGLSGDPDFREVLRRVRGVTLAAYEHQEVPFERLVTELQPERSLSHSPLFQVVFALDSTDPSGAELPGLRLRRMAPGIGTTKFDLTLDLTDGPGGVRGALGYGTDLFERATIRRMRGHLERLLEQVAADPGRPLSELELLTGEERRAVLEEWGGRDGAYHPAPVHRLVAAQCTRTPEAAAVSCGGRAVTFRELDAASSRLAHHLAARGAGPETVVALLAERTPGTVVAMLAVLKAGAAYLPLDPAYPEDRLRYMLADSGARLLVTDGALPDALRGEGAPPVVDLRAEAEAIAARPDRAPEVPVDPANLAYVIYTSGSTGRPKGVAVPHHGVPNEAWWMHSRCGLNAGDRVLQFASFSFDAAVNELFGALLAGATLVTAARDALVPGDALRETLRRERISFVTLPPSVLAVMDPAGLPDLRVVLSAGEALPPAAAEPWARAVELHNAYGPTEATVGASSARVAPGGKPTIGRPLENVRAFVLDPAGQPVPAGVPGELYVGGAGVARGYLGRADLTAERFVPDALGGRPGARLYGTGDRVRWRADGELEYLGRVDGQVKVRGFRIEPGEIEAVLGRHPGVDDCAVVVREDVPGDRRLVAYVVGRAGAEEARAHLRRHLPDFMVPGPVISLGALPLTPSGKTDRRALPAPEACGGATRRTAETELEARIAAVWAEVLGMGEVGVEDNFFDLGGHSLLLVKLQARLAAAVGAEVRVVELFQYPTVRALAERLRGGSGGGAVEQAGERGGTRQAALGRRLEGRRRRGA